MIFIFSIPFIFAAPVVPGWHITIYPGNLLVTIIITIVLLLGTIGYWALSRRNDRINRTLYIAHFALTATTALYLSFPTILLDMQRSDEGLLPALAWRIRLLPYMWSIFITAQALFFIYYARTIKIKKQP
jgi:hypothetical protein